jgi:hypothetical protein
MSFASAAGLGATNLVTLADVVHRLGVIEEIMCPMQPMKDQMVTLEATVAEQGHQQITLNLALTLLENWLFHRRAGHDDAGIDFMPTTHKLEFPKFDGKGDPLPWLYRCERYFRVCRTPENMRVPYVTFHLLADAQLWFHHLKLNNGQPLWNRFVQLVNTHFGLPLKDNPIRELTILHCEGTVDEFYNRFMVLSCRDSSLTEAQQILLFIMGFGLPLPTDVILQQLGTLNDAVKYAQYYEQCGSIPTCWRTFLRQSNYKT